MEHPIFADGHATTRFIEDAFPDGWALPRRHAGLARAVAAALAAESPVAEASSPWSGLRGFRVLAPAGGLAETALTVTGDGATTALTVAAHPDGARRVSGEAGIWVFRLHAAGGGFDVESDGQVTRGLQHVAGEAVHLMLGGEIYDFTVQAAARAATSDGSTAEGSGNVLAPMPGIVAEVKVVPGQDVAAEDVVVVLESMKLFVSLTAGVAGTVAEVTCRPGETVPVGRRLIMVQPYAG